MLRKIIVAFFIIYNAPLIASSQFYKTGEIRLDRAKLQTLAILKHYSRKFPQFATQYRQAIAILNSPGDLLANYTRFLEFMAQENMSRLDVDGTKLDELERQAIQTRCFVAGINNDHKAKIFKVLALCRSRDIKDNKTGQMKKGKLVALEYKLKGIEAEPFNRLGVLYEKATGISPLGWGNSAFKINVESGPYKQKLKDVPLYKVEHLEVATPSLDYDGVYIAADMTRKRYNMGKANKDMLPTINNTHDYRGFFKFLNQIRKRANEMRQDKDDDVINFGIVFDVIPLGKPVNGIPPYQFIVLLGNYSQSEDGDSGAFDFFRKDKAPEQFYSFGVCSHNTKDYVANVGDIVYLKGLDARGKISYGTRKEFPPIDMDDISDAMAKIASGKTIEDATDGKALLLGLLEYASDVLPEANKRYKGPDQPKSLRIGINVFPEIMPFAVLSRAGASSSRSSSATSTLVPERQAVAATS